MNICERKLYFMCSRRIRLPFLTQNCRHRKLGQSGLARLLFRSRYAVYAGVRIEALNSYLVVSLRRCVFGLYSQFYFFEKWFYYVMDLRFPVLDDLLFETCLVPLVSHTHTWSD